MRVGSSEGYSRLMKFRRVRKNLVEDINFRKYFEGGSQQLSLFYRNIIQKDLCYWCQWLPDVAIERDPNAYLHKHNLRQRMIAYGT